MCFESYLVDIPLNSRCINIGASNTCYKLFVRNEDQTQRNWFVRGTWREVKVGWIGTIKLKLESKFCLNLFDIVYVAMRRSLILFSRLDKPN